MSLPRDLGRCLILALALGLLGGCAGLSPTGNPSTGPTGNPSPGPSSNATSPSTQEDQKVVLSSFGGGFNGLESAFVATSRLGVRALGVTTINLSDEESPGRYLSFRTYENADFAPGKSFDIGDEPTSGSSLTYSDNGKIWVSTGGGQARMQSRDGNDTAFVIENVPMAPKTPLYLAGGATGSVTVNFSGTFTSYSF